MQAWVYSICIVAFDEELGQKLVLQHPSVLGEAEQKALAYLAFPDSNSCSDVGDVVYMFRMRKDSPLPLSCSAAHDHTFFHGFVFFRQCKDASKPRGYFQQSLVVLTQLPYFSLFKQVASILGPMYFEHGESLIEAAYHCVENWPACVPGTNVELPLLGTVLSYLIPSPLCSPQRDLSLTDGLDCILEGVDQAFPGSFQDLSLYTTLGHEVCTKHLWHVWELVLTGKSLLLVADSPTYSSEAVLALISTIAPLSFQGDFRPYFTLFDTDFKEFQVLNDGVEGAQVVLGTTNPFFLKAFSSWPSVLTMERGTARLKAKQKPRIPPHKQTLKNLMQTNSREALAINNSVLRRHFRELTLALLQPFTQYCALGAVSPLSDVPKFAQFEPGEFIRGLKSQRKLFPLLRYTSRNKAVRLYDSFLNSTTFRNWFAAQRQRAAAAAQESFLVALQSLDALSMAEKLDLAQVRALYQRVEGAALQRDNEHDEVAQRLRGKLRELLELRPEAGAPAS